MRRRVLAFVALTLIAAWHAPTMAQSDQEWIKALGNRICEKRGHGWHSYDL